MWNIIYLCTGFALIFLLVIIYKSKPKVKSKEIVIFERLIIINLIGYVVEIILQLLTRKYGVSFFLTLFFSKMYLIYLFVWISVFSQYVFTIFIRDKNKSNLFDKYNLIHYVFMACGILLLIALPVMGFDDGKVMYSFGPAADCVKILIALYIVLWSIVLVLSIKNIINKRYYPIIVIIFSLLLNVFIQTINPSILIATFVMTYTCYILYFTIENPDTQIIDLLTRNKELTEQSVNEKSNFLFKISQELRKPIKDISKDINLLKEEENKDIEKELIEQIDNSAKCANFIINNITDISSMDVKNSRIKEDNYNIKRLFKDIELSTNNNLKNSNKDGKIRFIVKENTSYPETVYGDKIKLKQILMSIINNSIKYTDAGHIDLEIDAIARYDMCRFILTITDTGMGMDISKVNKLLSKEEELTDNMVEENNLNLSLPVVHKLLKVVGGNINITSKENKGTIVTVVINQEINYDSTGLILKDINNYSNPKRRLRVLLVDNNDELERVKKILDEKDVDKVITLFGQDCVDKIEHNEDYDLIIIKDELGNETAFEILDKLKQIPRFKIPVIVAINKEKEFIKEHFIEDGFKDCIIFNDDSKQMIDILSKYL